ncbi:MAG: DUF4214 domain-containing protein [Candidatus Dojkabacteria bacterium]|nr:DUF4214 domain-containing protein [Candidatus Dojkabacteria bacterium]
MPDNQEQTIEQKTKQNISNFFGESLNSINEEQEQKEEFNFTEIVSSAYKEILNREPDLSGLKQYSNKLKFGLMTESQLKEELRNSEEYKKKFGTLDNQLLLTQFQTSPSGLVYCMIGTNRIDEIKPYIETVLPYIDKFIFIDGGSEDGTIEYLNSINKDEKIEIYIHKWEDKFSGQRNNYLDYLRKVNHSGWCITSDTDEHFPEETLKQLKILITESNNGENYTGVKFRAYDIIVDDDNRNIIKNEKLSKYWKPLLFKFHQHLRYSGEPHETLTGHPVKWFESELRYDHIRSSLHILSRAAENYFISNSNRCSDRWAEFRYLCTKNNILTFKDYWTLFQEHNLPKEIEDWLTSHKDDNIDDGDSELRETYMLYNEVLPKRKLKNDITEAKEPKSENKEEKEAIYNYQNHFGTTSGTSTSNFPDITVHTNLLTSPKQSEYELISHYCEQCSSPNEALIEMIIHHKHGITLCKKCWLNLANYIKKKIGD